MTYKKEYNPNFGKLGAEVSQLWPEKQIIEAKGKKVDTLGLALSGGGYRSDIFCYGILKGLWDIGVLQKTDYLSVVSGGSWIGTALSITENLKYFFRDTPTHPNFIEEGFESLLPNPLRVAQEARLSLKNPNYASNIYGRLLAKTFLREHGDYGRFKPLSDGTLIQDSDRPYLIINGTANFRRPGGFDITQECFEMTRLYCGSRSLGYTSTSRLKATKYPIRIRDAIAISGAALAFHLPGLSDHVGGFGLSREIPNYAKDFSDTPPLIPTTDEIDLADGGFYNNLGIESLINRGCGYIIVVDAEHDIERKTKTRSNQTYNGLKTLLARHHIKVPKIQLEKLDKANEVVHEFKGSNSVPDILYIKLKSSTQFDTAARRKSYNNPSFLESLFSRGTFSFDPQFSTAKLDYDFAEHRNLSELGYFFIKQKKARILNFSNRSK